MKLYWFSGLLFLMLCAFRPAPYGVQLQDDHGDSYLLATAIYPNDSPLYGNLDSVDDLDYFSFYATLGTNYTIEISYLDSSCDGHIALYDTEGMRIIPADDDVNDEGASMTTWPADFSDKVYIKVEASTDSRSCAYEISVSESEKLFAAARLAGTCDLCEQSSDCASGVCGWFIAFGLCCQSSSHCECEGIGDDGSKG